MKTNRNSFIDKWTIEQDAGNLPDEFESDVDELLEQVAREQREHDLNEIKDERGNQEIKWNIRNSPLVTQNNKE